VLYIIRTVDVSAALELDPPCPSCRTVEIIIYCFRRYITRLSAREGAPTTSAQDKWAFSRSTTKQTETTSDFFTPACGKHCTRVVYTRLRARAVTSVKQYNYIYLYCRGVHFKYYNNIYLSA